MKRIWYVLVLILFVSLCGCNRTNEWQTNIKNSEIIANYPEIAIEAKEVSKSDGIFIIKNYSSDTFIYGLDYELQEYRNNEWYKIKYKDGNITVLDLGIYLSPGEEKEIYHNWSLIYGDLPCGKYRILKRFAVDKTEEFSCAEDRFIIAGEFNIEKHSGYLRDRNTRIRG